MVARDRAHFAPRRLHVLHVSMPTTEGVGKVALGYIRDQVERGWQVTLACPSDGTLGYDARAAGARVHWWPARRDPGASVFAELDVLRQILESSNPDVVHLHSSKAGLVGRLVIRDRIPTVFQPHAWSFLAAQGRVRTIALAWERYATRWTSELVCVSEGERRIGQDNDVVAPATVIPNGVDLDEFSSQGDTERRLARTALGLRAAPTVLCVGRLAPQKGQEDLLAAWASIRARVPDAELVLLGDGPSRDRLIKRASALPAVNMPGRRTDVLSWYAAADVVVVPSRWEGMALVQLEAMACSRSVVATDVSGVRDSLPPEAGAIVPAHDREALADAIVARLLDPGLAEDEGWNGRSHVELNHDAVKPSRDLSRVYLRLVGARRER